MAQYDMHAKRLLADKNVLSYILINCIVEFRDYSLDEAKAAIEGEPEVARRMIEPAREA